MASNNYQPRYECSLYDMKSGCCKGLRVLICSEQRDCPFYKGKNEYKKQLIASAKRRRSLGMPLTSQEHELLWKEGRNED